MRYYTVRILGRGQLIGWKDKTNLGPERVEEFKRVDVWFSELGYSPFWMILETCSPLDI